MLKEFLRIRVLMYLASLQPNSGLMFQTGKYIFHTFQSSERTKTAVVVKWRYMLVMD